MGVTHGSFLRGNPRGGVDLLVPRTHGGADHWGRDGEEADWPWLGPGIVFGSHEDVTGVSLIHSNAGGALNMHALYREGARVAHDWGERPPAIWHGATYLPGGLDAIGAPSVIDAGDGFFHVLAPVAQGVAHWTGQARGVADSSDPAHPPLIVDWGGPAIFAAPGVNAVALLRGSFDNLEAVLRASADLVHYWHDAGSGQWNGPVAVDTGAAGDPCWREGGDGNYELISPAAGGGFAHWTRFNAQEGFPWSAPVRFGEGEADAVGFEIASDNTFVVVARRGRELREYRRDPGTLAWSAAVRISLADLDPAEAGNTSVPIRAGMVGIHSSVLRTGKVLLFGFADEEMTTAESRLIDPVTGGVAEPTGAGHAGHAGSTPHVFCSGHAFLPDGKLLVTGGHHLDIKSLNVFDPSTRAWSNLGSMPEGRWYPTCCALPGGRVATVAGTGGFGGTEQPVNNTLQIFDPAAGLGPEIAIPSPFSAHFDAAHPVIDTYPVVLSLPSGKLLVHSRCSTRFVDPVSGVWDDADLRTQYRFARTYPGQGNGLLLPLRPGGNYRARVLLVGGCGEEFDRIWWGVPATNTAEILDLGDPEPSWRFTAPMSFDRVMCDSLLLPDGTVFVAGGSARGASVTGANPVLLTELFDPASETWRLLAPIEVPRLYHAAAVLLPDARVMLSGTDGILNPFPYHYPEHRVEIFSPPYLFRGPRPTIQSAPAEIGYRSTFVVQTPAAASISSAMLMRPDSATHSVHMDQRAVELEIPDRTANRLELAGPPDSNVAPEGFYMLFLLNDRGVPSVARFVRLR